MSVVVALLTRSPSDPRLKARIAPLVPEFEQRRELVLAFIDDLTERVSALPDVTLSIAVTPPVEGFRLARPWIAGRQLLPQRGAVFGDRLRNVIADLAATGTTQIVLLGADVPDLPASALTDAVARVRASATTVVTGPAGDGSFYLLGLTVANRVVPDLFTNVRWGTPYMLEDVEAAARAHGLTVSRVLDWHDVDTPEDVRELAARLRYDPAAAPRTARVLEGLSV